MPILSTIKLVELKPGAVVETPGQVFWIRLQDISDTYFELQGMFVNLQDGEILQADYLTGTVLISDGPNHVINTLLEEWEK